jgi:hypothetical protein
VSFTRLVLAALAAVLVAVGLYVAAALLGGFGEHEGAGEPTAARMPAAVVAERAAAQHADASSLTVTPPAKQILFGDLHVHTTFSSDAFLASLPILQGEGAHPVSDACDYARFCSGLDFWSINDHAEASTPRRWQETQEAIRRCDALAGDAGDPDVVPFLGWEWSQVGATPAEHYGHKNVVLRDLEDVPVRPIGAAGLASEGLRGAIGRLPRWLPFLDFPNRQRYWNFLEFAREITDVEHCPEGVASPELPDDCYESAATPADLFRKLREWNRPALVIPHGNTWGFYSPPGTTWDKQLAAAQHDPTRQILLEVMSGHGNSEEFRSFREIELGADGRPLCPEPRPDYLPSCWRAGEIVAERCRAAGEDEAECAERAAAARQHYAEAGVLGHRAVPGARSEDWLDAGQCRDCFLPAFNYRPGGSSQYALAISDFEDGPGDEPRRFRFGFIASSDNHQARPGTGYKEFGRKGNTEARGARDETWRRRVLGALGEEAPQPRSRAVDIEQALRGIVALEAERQASFFLTGGLAAVHASGRSRAAIWDALVRKEVYGTSGDRILLWFHLLNAPAPGGAHAAVPMGAEVAMSEVPRFEVRAVGARRQRQGCPDFAAEALGAARLASLCRDECHHPGEERKLVTRIEVVRVRPQARPGEPVAALIEDPWRIFPCEPSQAGCAVQFEDREFAAARRDTVYYVRAIEEPSPAVNAGLLRCERDAEGRCLRVNPCYGDYRTPDSDDCPGEIEERAWSSPIYVDAAG